MKVFITGGTGFIGRRLVRHMTETKHEIYCLARRTNNTNELEKHGAKIVVGDVQDKDSLLKGMQGCDWLVNLANLYSFWEPDKSMYRKINVIGTQNVLECALGAGLSKVIHISTVAIYGKPSDIPFSEDSTIGPVRFSEYAQTKYESDLIAWKLYREKKLPLVMIFPAAVLGSGDISMAGQSIDRLIHKKMPARLFTKKLSLMSMLTMLPKPFSGRRRKRTISVRNILWEMIIYLSMNSTPLSVKSPGYRNHCWLCPTG
jgi:nucleoside-diphosphate-sugar epimerase